MKTMQGPGLFLAQFASDEAPFDSWDAITKWAADCGYAGVQVPSWDARLIDLDKAATSDTYCEEFLGTARANGVEVTELSTHLQGQLVAVHPAYDEGFDGFAVPDVRGDPKRRQAWAVEQVGLALDASRRLGLTAQATFSGALAWPYLYPWPQRPAGLVERAFDELGRRWRPLLDKAEDCGVDLCYEIHPGEDLHDGISFEMFLERVGDHPRARMLYDPSHYVLQHLDYLANIDDYHALIGMFHVKDAELNPTGKQGVYGGFQSWVDRAGRFRSVGDGQGDLLEARHPRLRRLGRGRVGVLPQAPRGRRTRGGGLRPGSHHPRDRQGLRRLRRRRYGRRGQCADAGARSLTACGSGGDSGSDGDGG